MEEAISRAADILKYEPLKEEQRKAIAGFLSGQDVFVVLRPIHTALVAQRVMTGSPI